MTKRVEARRYSQAVFQIALERGQLDMWQSDLRKLADVVSDAAVTAWLEDRKVAFEEKSRLLSENMTGVNPMVLNLLRLLVVKGKPGLVGEIADDYQRLLDGHRGIQQAEVTTAVPLDESDVRKLEQQLGVLVGKKVVVKPVVDAGVIGGIVARIDGKLLDASTRSKLEALRRELAGMGGKG